MRRNGGGCEKRLLITIYRVFFAKGRVSFCCVKLLRNDNLGGTMMKVFVSGCFDLMHSGHVFFFERAAAYGDLYVAIGSDKTIRELKNGNPCVVKTNGCIWFPPFVLCTGLLSVPVRGCLIFCRSWTSFVLMFSWLTKTERQKKNAGCAKSGTSAMWCCRGSRKKNCRAVQQLICESWRKQNKAESGRPSGFCPSV